MNIAAAYERRLGLLGTVPFLMLTVLAVFGLKSLTVDPALAGLLPDDDPLRIVTEEAGRHMREPDYVQVFVSGEDIFSGATIDALERLTARLGELESVRTVVSATTASDLQVVDGALVWKPLLAEGSDLRRSLAGDALFSEYLLTPDAGAHVVYVFPDESAAGGAVARDILGVLDEFEGTPIHAFGRPLLMLAVENAVRRDVIVLGWVSLILVFLVELVVTRDLRTALTLWVVSAATAVWTLAMYPVLGQSLSTYNVMVPVTILALATSYGIHIVTYARAHREKPFSDCLTAVTPIVLSTAATTIVGFGSLLVTGNYRLQSLGVLVAVGVLLAVLASLFCLPAFLARLPRPEPTTRSSQVLARTFRHPRYALLAFLAIIAVSGVGALRVRPDPSPADDFTSSSAPGALFDRYHELTGANQQLELYIDTGREFGLVDMEVYAGLARVQRELGRHPAVVDTLGLASLVEWINGRLAGHSTPLPPANEMELGESIELLFSRDTGLGVDALIDPEYRRSKILFLYNDRGADIERALRDREALFESLESIMPQLLPEVRYNVIGPLAANRRSETYLRSSQLLSATVFFAFLVGLLLYLYRDLRWIAVAVLPTASGVLFYYALAGWFGVPIVPLTVFFIASLMGVSNDDVLYLTLSVHRRRPSNVTALQEIVERSGPAIIHTTGIIAVGISTFGFSSYRHLGPSGLILAASLILCSCVTLFVVPALLRRFAVGQVEFATGRRD